MQDIEVARIKSIQDELHVHLREIPIDEPSAHAEAERAGSQAIEKIFKTADQLPAMSRPSGPGADNGPLTATRQRSSLPDAGKKKIEIAASKAAAATAAERTPAEQLTDAMAELDRLIGLDNIKQEVRTLANFLKVQAKRRQPATTDAPCT
jgi:hypothetical protein